MALQKWSIDGCQKPDKTQAPSHLASERLTEAHQVHQAMVSKGLTSACDD